MNPTTLFLASLIGPLIVAIGFGIYLSRAYYIKVYQRLEDETLAVFLAATISITVGIAMVLHHNLWGTTPEIIISAIGWLAIMKGVLLAVTPKYVEVLSVKISKSSFFSAVGPLLIVLGLYLSWIAYLQ